VRLRVAHRHLGRDAVALRVHDRPAGGHHRLIELLLIGSLVDPLRLLTGMRKIKNRADIH
jgi:hypothetical protein